MEKHLGSPRIISNILHYESIKQKKLSSKTSYNKCFKYDILF